MKLNFLVSVRLFVLLILFVTLSCKKDAPKQITSVLTTAITNTGPGTLSGGGNVVSDGGDPIIARGVCWSLKQHSYTAYDSTLDGSGTGKYNSTITGLKPGYLYYIKAYAINKYGVSFGGEFEITINPVLPIIFTTGVKQVTANTIVVGGTLASNGGAITRYGVCWSTVQNPTINDNNNECTDFNISFTSNITGLSSATTYYLRFYAINNVGTVYSDQLTITTKALLPTITTNLSTNVTSYSADCGGNITSDGGAPITKRGIIWSLQSNPSLDQAGIYTAETTTGGLGTYTFSMTKLLPKTTYYVRAYCFNSSGCSYGVNVSTTTPEINNPTISDIDGNLYHVVKIGNQEWLMENLKVTHYRNGDPIPYYTNSAGWAALTKGAYCWEMNDVRFKDKIGALYNFYSIMDSRNICPVGWHIPTYTEWQTLIDFLGGKDFAGNKLKETGSIHWGSGNINATNESCFTALPSGFRDDSGSFQNVTDWGFWWGIRPSQLPKGVWIKSVNSYYQSIDDYSGNEKYGISVRCIKD